MIIIILFIFIYAIGYALLSRNDEGGAVNIEEYVKTINENEAKKGKHLYTDDECIGSCYFEGKNGGYGGHLCLFQLDESLEEEYKRILAEKGREGLWQYGIENGFFTNDSPDYYGFFGKDYSEN